MGNGNIRAPKGEQHISVLECNGGRRPETDGVVGARIGIVRVNADLVAIGCVPDQYAVVQIPSHPSVQRDNRKETGLLGFTHRIDGDQPAVA